MMIAIWIMAICIIVITIAVLVIMTCAVITIAQSAYLFWQVRNKAEGTDADYADFAKSMKAKEKNFMQRMLGAFDKGEQE